MLQTKHTRDPAMMTGFRPILSANLPLNGREMSAVTVNKAMISPLCSPPPNEDRNDGSSGTIMLKLAKKSSELMQSSQNGRVYILDESVTVTCNR